MGGGVAGQGAVQQGLDGGVGRARHPAVKADAGRCQGGLGAAADAAADQGVGVELAQQGRQGAVALAVGADHLAAGDLAVFHVVQLELGGVAEVGKDAAVLVGDCNSHTNASFLKGRDRGPAGGFHLIVARFGPGCQRGAGTGSGRESMLDNV